MRVGVGARHQEVLGEHAHVRRHLGRPGFLFLEGEHVDEHQDRQAPHALLPEAFHPPGELGREIGTGHAVCADADPVERRPVGEIGRAHV